MLLITKKVSSGAKSVGFFLPLATLLLTACAFSPVAVEPNKTFTLDAELNKAPSLLPTSEHTVLVSSTRAAPALQSNAMLYIEKAHQINSYNHNQWLAPPAEMVHALLVATLQNSGYFRAVLTPPFSARSDYSLDSRLEKLYFQLNDEKTVHVRLTVNLLDNRTRQAIASKTFNKQAVLPISQPAAGVQQANRLFAEILSELVDFVVSALPTAEE